MSQQGGRLSRGWIAWLAVNVVGALLHVLASRPFWLSKSALHELPVDAQGRPYVVGGPGDGLYFLVFLAAPLLFALLVNLGVLVVSLYSAVRYRRYRGLLFAGALLVAWLGVQVWEDQRMSVPGSGYRTSG